MVRGLRLELRVESTPHIPRRFGLACADASAARLTGPYGSVPGLDVSREMVNIEDDECNPVNFIDGIERTHVRSMRNHD